MLALLAVLSWPVRAVDPPPLVFVAARNNTLPLAHFDGDRLESGLLRDASRAIQKGLIVGSAFGGDFGHLTAAAIAEKYQAHAKLTGQKPAPTNASGQKGQ